jgi:hypothetical protein
MRLRTHRIVKSTWLPFAIQMTMSQVPSTTLNYSWTCLPTTVRWTPPGRERGAQKDSAVEERQAHPAQAECGKPSTQPNTPKEPQKRFRSSCRSGVSHIDWRHCRSNAPSSTTTTQSPDTKAAVSNLARACATRWTTPSVLNAKHALEI